MTAEWSTIPDDVKQYVLDYLHYDDKQILSQCSKADRLLVKNSKWVWNRIDYVVNRDSRKSMEVYHEYRRDIFWKEENGTTVEKSYRQPEGMGPRWRVVSEHFVEERDWQELAAERLNEILKKQNYQVQDLYMDLFTQTPVFSRQLSVNTLQIHAVMRPIPLNSLIEMINSVKPTVDWLQLVIPHEIPSGLGQLDTIKRAKRLVFSNNSGLTDTDLLNFEGHMLDIENSKITKKGVREFILKRMAERKECQFDLNTEEDGENVADGFHVEENPPNVLVFSYFPTRFRLFKDDFDFSCYLVELGDNLRGIVTKTV